MRTTIGVLALLMAGGCCGEARSAGWPSGGGGHAPPRVGVGSGNAVACGDDVFCPLYSHFVYYPRAVNKASWQESLPFQPPPPPGNNPDVFLIPPLPYGPGRTPVRSSPAVKPAAASTPDSGTKPAAPAAATPPAAAPAPPSID